MTLKQLHEVSMKKWLKITARNWLEIIALFTVTHYINHWAMYLVCWIILGTRMHGLALLGHEAIHYNLSRNKKLNDCVGNFFAALPMGLTVTWFRKFHLTHHHHLSTEDDPEVDWRRNNKSRWELPLSTGKRIRLFTLDLSGFGYLENYKVVEYSWSSMSKWDLILPILFWSGIFSIFYSLNLLWIPLIWVISIPTSYWAMFRQRALVEHIGCSNDNSTHRTYAHPIARFFYLPHNCWHHWEHHKWQGIPCWNLPAARKLDQTEPVITLPELFEKLKTVKD